MKRIYSVYFTLACLLALPFSSIASNDTTSNSNDRSITLHGTLAGMSAAYGWNYFELNWTTLGGFDRFEVERSIDGNQFDQIGRIDATTGSVAGSGFQFRDHFHGSVARKNDFYYRLKQFTPDGNFTYSKVLIARMYNTRSLASLSVTPDPIANDILVNVQLKQNAYVVMKVTDASGKEIIRENKKADSGTQTYSLNETHKLQKGLYTLEVIVNSNERLTMQLQKS
jgi:hypothetical protein